MNDINELREAIRQRQSTQPVSRHDILRTIMLISLTLAAFVLIALAVM